MNSAFVAEFMRSGNVAKAIQVATANASSVVMYYGAKEGILRKGDTGRWPPVAVTARTP
jgi:sugar/nucleoside kinase (ribokinase family)